MDRTLFFAVDGSENTMQALDNVGRAFLDTDIHLCLFHAVPESAALYPGELSTISGEPSELAQHQQRLANTVLERAVQLLLQLGYNRSRLHTEAAHRSADPAQDILGFTEKRPYTAVVLARKGRSLVKRFLVGSTTTKVCQYGQGRHIWAVGTAPLQPPRVLAAIDESSYAERLITHLAENFASLAGASFTLCHIMPAKPPGYWDDGHILDDNERAERQAVVARWRTAYENKLRSLFVRARELLQRGGAHEGNIHERMQTQMSGVARDILAELKRGRYNVLALGRRGTSTANEFSLGSCVAKLLQSPSKCTLVLVN
ncbi:MAG: universal stress protein [Deltaproteobacteria bacterium]|nr:universal stress protein [Deltaproteobacteria bacterium]MBW2071236.1 universal stress protein [Deltaproteobacteria bacterium]